MEGKNFSPLAPSSTTIHYLTSYRPPSGQYSDTVAFVCWPKGATVSGAHCNTYLCHKQSAEFL